MHFMVEFYISGSWRLLIADFWRRAGMALDTVSFDTKGGAVVMTGAAGLPLFHHCHCAALVARPGYKK